MCLCVCGSRSVMSDSLWCCGLEPVSSVHGISPVRILEWVDMSPSRGSSRPRDQILVSSTSILPLFQDFFCISNVNYREKDGAFCKIRSPRIFLLHDITANVSTFRNFQYGGFWNGVKIDGKMRGSKTQSGWLYSKGSAFVPVCE